MTDAFAELVERITREADEGFFHTAAQLVVVHGDECVLDIAVGRTHLHEPFRRDTLSALYCTAKPIVAVAVLRLVADGSLRQGLADGGRALFDDCYSWSGIRDAVAEIAASSVAASRAEPSRTTAGE